MAVELSSSPPTPSTHNRRPETDAESKGINEWPAEAARGQGLGARKERERPRARPGEGSGGENGGPAPPRSAYGDSRTLRLGAEAAGLGARVWEIENWLRRTSGRNHSPLPLPGCACLEPPPLSSFRRTRRTRFSGSAAEDDEPPSASGSLLPLRSPLTSHLRPSAHTALSRLLDLGLANNSKVCSLNFQIQDQNDICKLLVLVSPRHRRYIS